MILHIHWPLHVMLRNLVVLGLLALLALLALASRAPGDEPSRKETKATPEILPLEKALKKARVSGKYEMLLRQFKVGQDAAQYADFRDLGLRDTKEYAGFTELPKGHWVYVYPYWYIWRDLAATPKVKRAWGPEQAAGPPDTNEAGDIQTAWASRTPDDQDEWLLLEYPEAIVPEAVLVYETYNPGALVRVTLFKLDGEEVEVWKGKDPTPVNSGKGISEVTFRAPFKTNRVKIYLDSKNIPGWNEIDAVGLRDTAGKTHWAKSVEASSTYAQDGMAMAPIAVAPAMPVVIRVVPAVPLAPPAALPAPAPAPAPAAVPLIPRPAANKPAAPKTGEERIQRLEEEVKELKETIKALQKQIERLRK
jgi:hypothetical protein